MNAFEQLGLSARIARTVTDLGYDTPTPIQTEAIPLVLKGRDLMGLAQTGTGKTAAFGLPLAQRLMNEGGRPQPRSARALILAPTRELVNQIAENLKAYVKGTPVSIVSVVGGVSINNQIRAMQRGADILIATPGRLIDLVERKAVILSTATYLVLDEADQMLDMGFIHALRQISKLVGKTRQTLLFSATMPEQISELAATYLTDPVRVQVTPPGKAADKIAQSVHFVADKGAKFRLLTKLLAEDRDHLALVFSRTKHGAEKLMKQLVQAGFQAASIHGNKSQGQRDRAIKGFRDGEIRVLVATDVAARGIDIPGVSHVYNFDLPEVSASYVHRIGRTARAGADGLAVAFCAPEEVPLLRDIEKVMKMTIPVASGEAPAVIPPAPKRGGGHQQQPRQQRSGNPSGQKQRQGRPANPAKEKPAAANGNARPDGQRPRRRRRRTAVAA